MKLIITLSLQKSQNIYQISSTYIKGIQKKQVFGFPDSTVQENLILGRCLAIYLKTAM